MDVRPYAGRFGRSRESGKDFDGIIGKSIALQQVLEHVEVVAPTDSTVLIQGETGTGKELIARAIHNLSGRRVRPFVTLNCAAIPSGLLESELFGHEKGAFTGAVIRKTGRFELAHGGTLFLDEVGDIPLELQSKFLRVLEDQEFERLGSAKTLRVNVRMVAATNRDLGTMVSEKRFRSDLYYRLNVFPIVSPPLRERQEDIGPLVNYFTQKFARRMNKRIEMISTETISALCRYHWPGNIRELENFVERAVIVSEGPNLDVALDPPNTSALSAATSAEKIPPRAAGSLPV
jgi:formate hydrogenlyase transcriptional activator